MADQSTTGSDQWTVRRVLDWTIEYLKSHGCENPRLDAEILLAHSRGCQRIQLYTQYEELLTDSQRELMRSLVKRRAAAEPVAYLVGHREFFSLDFEVTRDVFIPRPDTETLVMAALDVLKTIAEPTVLELCTGSACIPVAIAKNHRSAKITTVEKDADVFKVAARNISKHDVADRVRLLAGNLFEPIDAETKFSLIVSNPPYIPTEEILRLEADVKDHEPHQALDGGADGLDLIRLIIQSSPDYLVNNGWLMFELSPEQSETAMDLMKQRGFTRVSTQNDLAGAARVVLGMWSGE